MGDIAWSGIYIRAPRDQFGSALNRIATARHFKRIKYSEHAKREDIEELRRYLGLAGEYEVVGWYPTADGWTRLVGFELDLYSYPRLLFPSEIILLLGCDAFECGFHSRPNRWWYKYYESGVLVDRYEANMDTTINPVLLPVWDPNDLGTIYAKCVIYEDYPTASVNAEIILPAILSQYYHGDGSGLLRLAKPGQQLAIEAILQEENPEQAIYRLSQLLQLPDIGKFSLEELVELDFGWPDIDIYLQLLELGFTIAVFQHPKVALLAG